MEFLLPPPLRSPDTYPLLMWLASQVVGFFGENFDDVCEGYNVMSGADQRKRSTHTD